MHETANTDLRAFRGGVAEKLGNTFEADWAVQQALLVLQGEAQSIVIEPLLGAAGFEFVLARTTGLEYHQCKRRGPGARSWTVGSIAGTGFWAQALERHARDPSAHFVFVSTDSAGEASRLTEHAARLSSPTEFRKALSKADQVSLADLVAKTSLPDDAATCRFLRQVRFETVSERSLRSGAVREARYLYREDGVATCNAIRRMLNDHLTQTLSTETLRRIAQDAGLTPRPAAFDPTILESIAKQNRRFEESHGSLGVSGRAIARTISSAIADAFRSDDLDLAVITGVAGVGKSGILRRTADMLEADGVPCLRIRIDSQLSVTTVDELGAALFGAGQNPCTALSLAAPAGGYAILVLDQLDAVSEASGRALAARTFALDLIEEARACHNLKVVVACRSYDLDTDRRLRNLHETPRGRRFEAELLDIDTEVAPFLDGLGIDRRQITPTQWELIRLPINLVHFAQLSAETGTVIRAGSTAELYRELLDKRAHDLREHTWSVHQALGDLAERMSETRTLTAPKVVLDPYKGADKLLVSAHLLNPDGDAVRFAHESLFDYCFARAFVGKGKALTPWLIGDTQILFRRTQVRQVLELLRAAERDRYLEEIEALLASPDVRAHIKDAVASWLGTLREPTDEELTICLALDDGLDQPNFIVRQAFGSASWARRLHERKLLDAWISAPNAARHQYAFSLLDMCLDGEPAIAAEVAHRWWNGDPTRTAELLHWLRHPRSARDIAPVADLYVEVIAQTSDAIVAARDLPDAADLGMWSHDKSDQVPRLLEAWIDRWYAAHPEGDPFGDRHADNAYWIREASRQHPIGFLNTMLKALATAFARELAAGTATPRWRSAFRVALPSLADGKLDEDRAILDIVRTALRATAAHYPVELGRLLSLLAPYDHFAALHLVLEAIDASGGRLDADGYGLLNHPLLFCAGYDEGPSDSGARALAALWDTLAPGDRHSFETLILGHFPELTRAVDAAKSENHRREIAILELGNVGAAQRNILARIGPDRLSAAGRDRLRALCRKFPNAQWPTPHDGAGFVSSPISLEAAKLMSDAQWLRAFVKHRIGRGDMRRFQLGIGGAEQLARVLQECAKADPARFTGLRERLPHDVHPDYPRAIWAGVAESEVTDDIALRASRVILASTSADQASSLCALVQRHPAIGEDDAVFDALEHLARKLPSPEPPTAARSTSKRARQRTSIEDLFQAAAVAEHLPFNSARGDAIRAFASALWGAPRRLERVAAFTDEQIISETSPAMRIALISCVHAVAGRDVDRGLAQLEALTLNDASPLATKTGRHLISYAFWNRRAAGDLLRDRLDAVDDYRPVALWLLAHYSVEDDTAAEAMEALWAHDAMARRMAANAAVEACGNSDFQPNARVSAWLKRLFHDTDEDVLRTASDFGRHIKGADAPTRADIALAYVASPAFLMDPGDLFHGLNDIAAQHPDVVVAACERYLTAEKDPEFRLRQRGGAARYQLAKLIFSVYPALEKKTASRSAILDIVDMFLSSDVADARRELERYERH